MKSIPKTSRLFFALWPSGSIRQSIVEALSNVTPPVEGNMIPSANLHLTLHFVGQITEEDKQCMHAAAQSIDVKRFDLKLDCFGCFSRAKIFWMGCSEPVAGLTTLHQKLAAALESCGYQREARVYTPHVSLVRKCVRPEISWGDFSIPWSVEAFVLVESISVECGVFYKVIEKYPLF
ncbi:MAG: RNA 2',3'-cyclic phosphodiesterase [Gammaproteobacteria bacterium]|nr:RNA 2',3'-cyclic phosphodiesterase [Gammaproteobacteria bacterium]